MQRFLSKVRRFSVCEDGPTAIEYAVMLSSIIAVCALAVGMIGGKTKTMFQNAASSTAS